MASRQVLLRWIVGCCWLCVVVAVVCWLGLVSQAAAAPAELPVDESLSKLAPRIMAILRLEKFESDDDKQTLQKYFDNYFFPQWTRPPKQAAGKTDDHPERRAALFKFLRSARPRSEPYDYLVDISLRKCREMAWGEFDVGVRVNAMLTIGELNFQESPRAVEPPIPLPAAVPVMVQAVADPKQIDAVRVAALAGLLRHAKLEGIKDPAHRKEVLTAMLGLVQAASVPPARSPEGHAWMRAQAAAVLGCLGEIGANGIIAAALADMAGERKLAFSARCAAAAALGSLRYQGAGNLDGMKLVQALASLAADACEAEESQPVEGMQRRRRLRERLAAVEKGLEGINNSKLLTTEEQKALYNTANQTVQSLIEAIDDKKLPDDKLLESAAEARSKLAEALKKTGAKPVG